MQQEQSEQVDDFISRLKNLATKCQFHDSTEVEDRVLDQLIWGSKNPDVQKSLIGRDKSLTLAGAIEIARSHEATSKHMKTLAVSSESHQEDRSVDAIHKEQERESCNNCGKQHARNKCPAYGTLCRKCGKANHCNLSADPVNGTNLSKEESRLSKNLFTRLKTGAMKTMMKFSQSVESRLTP